MLIVNRASREKASQSDAVKRESPIRDLGALGGLEVSEDSGIWPNKPLCTGFGRGVLAGLADESPSDVPPELRCRFGHEASAQRGADFLGDADAGALEQP